MTAAVGSTAQGGAETLLQVAAGKATGGVHRAHLKQSDKIPSQSEDAPQNQSSADVDASEVTVEQTEKTTRRKHGKAGSNEDDTSFEDTFDNIGHEASKDENAKKADHPQIILPNLVLAQPTANGIEAGGSGIGKDSADGAQITSRPSGLLRQASILALMDAKDRIFSTVSDAKSSAAEQVRQATAGNGATSVVVTPITIDRRETHWNFDNKVMTNTVMANAALQVSTLQKQVSEKTQAATAAGSIIGTALPGVKTSDATPTATQKSAPAPKSDASQQIAVPDAEASAGQSFGDRDSSAGDAGTGSQDGAKLQSAASGNPAERKVAKADTPPSIDQIFAASAKPAQAQTSAADQVRSGVLDSLSGSNADPTQSTPGTAPSSRPTTTPVLRTLDLTLSPEDLGSVKLRLSLKSNSLAIEAEASKATTAKLLSDDRASLERGLRDAGYDVSSMKITDASATASTSPSNWQMGGSPSRDGDPARSAFAGRQDSGNAPSRDGSTFNQPQQRQKDDHPHATTADPTGGRLGNAVYI